MAAETIIVRVGGGLLLASLLISSSGCRERQQKASDNNTETLAVTLGSEVFHLEVALDPPARFQGLSDRSSLDVGGGMLFVFPDVEERQFVMRRCRFPIDIIFVGAAGRIVSIRRMAVEPPDTPEEDLKRYHSEWPAQFAIEISGGSLDKLQLNAGDRIDLPYDDLKRRSR